MQNVSVEVVNLPSHLSKEKNASSNRFSRFGKYQPLSLQSGKIQKQQKNPLTLDPLQLSSQLYKDYKRKNDNSSLSQKIKILQGAQHALNLKRYTDSMKELPKIKTDSGAHSHRESAAGVSQNGKTHLPGLEKQKQYSLGGGNQDLLQSQSPQNLKKKKLPRRLQPLNSQNIERISRQKLKPLKAREESDQGQSSQMVEKPLQNLSPKQQSIMLKGKKVMSENISQQLQGDSNFTLQPQMRFISPTPEPIHFSPLLQELGPTKSNQVVQRKGTPVARRSSLINPRAESEDTKKPEELGVFRKHKQSRSLNKTLKARLNRKDSSEQFSPEMNQKLEKLLSYDVNNELFKLNDQLHAIKLKSKSFRKNPHQERKKTVKFILPEQSEN